MLVCVLGPLQVRDGGPGCSRPAAGSSAASSPGLALGRGTAGLLGSTRDCRLGRGTAGHGAPHDRHPRAAVARGRARYLAPRRTGIAWTPRPMRSSSSSSLAARAGIAAGPAIRRVRPSSSATRSSSGAGARFPSSTTCRKPRPKRRASRRSSRAFASYCCEPSWWSGRADDLVATARVARRRAAVSRAPVGAAHARAVPVGPPGRGARRLRPGPRQAASTSSASSPALRCSGCSRRSSPRIPALDAPVDGASDERSSRSRLPGTATRLIGRAVERQDLTEVWGRARLATLVGPPGAGKTRLALEAAPARPRAPSGTSTSSISPRPSRVADAVLDVVAPSSRSHRCRRRDDRATARCRRGWSCSTAASAGCGEVADQVAAVLAVLPADPRARHQPRAPRRARRSAHPRRSAPRRTTRWRCSRTVRAW